MIQEFTPIDFNARRQKIAASVRAAGFDAYIGTRQGALHYLSGAFMPWRGAVIVTANGDCKFVYWAWDASRIREAGVDVDITPFTFSDFPQIGRASCRERGSQNVYIAVVAV